MSDADWKCIDADWNAWWYGNKYLVRVARHRGPPHWMHGMHWMVEVCVLVYSGEAPITLRSRPVFEEHDEALAVGRAWCMADEAQRAALEHFVDRGYDAPVDVIGRLVGKILGETV